MIRKIIKLYRSIKFEIKWRLAKKIYIRDGETISSALEKSKPGDYIILLPK